MSFQNKKHNYSSINKNSSNKKLLSKTIYSSNKNINNHQCDDRPKSHKSNRKKILFGTTALLNAKKALKQLQDKKENELFSRLQHKIKTEYLKYKTLKNYQKKEKRFDEYLKIRNYNKKNDLYERQLLESEKNEIHYLLNKKKQKEARDKINNFEYIYKKKEDKINFNLSQINQKMKENIGEEEMKNQEAQYRLKSLENQDKRRRYMIDRMMKEKDEKRRIKLERMASDQKFYLEQKNLEKRQEIDATLDLLRNRQIQFNKMYKMKQKRESEKMDRLNIRKQNEQKERELNNYYRFANHEYLIGQIQSCDNQRNNDYYRKLKIIEKNKILIQKEKDKKSAERKQMFEEKNDFVKFKLNNCEIMSNKFREDTKNKILERQERAEKVLNDKKIEHLMKVEENKERSREKEYIIKQIELDDNFKRDKQREEMDAKNEKINEFLYEKQAIDNKKRYINDNFTNEYNFYSNQIDEIMYKRPMDKIALNNIKGMVCDNPKLAGLAQNFDK